MSDIIYKSSEDVIYENDIAHYGIKRRSGRYPYGSGEEPFQHETNFSKTHDALKAKGLSEPEIRKAMGMTDTEYREAKSNDLAARKAAEYAYAIKLKEKGLSNQAIAEKLGKEHESYVRNLLADHTKNKIDQREIQLKALQAEVDSKGVVDVGKGSELGLGVNQTKLNNLCKELVDQGYVRDSIKIEQQFAKGQFTTLQYLAKPGMTKQDVYAMKDEIGIIGKVIDANNNLTPLGIQRPVSVDSKRIYVRYADDPNSSGRDKDGVIELRRNVPDLDLGNANYAQVRIAVNDTNYMKGMAVYSDNIPDGYDIVYNSNKTSDFPLFAKDETHSETVFKQMKTDKKTGEINWDNPFKTTLRMEDGKIVGQKMYIDKDGKEKLSPINIVREQGDWETWSKSLSYQFLGKQPEAIIKSQLKLSYDRKKEEYDEIMELTNPNVRSKLLEAFADSCDSQSVHLKAVGLPRQASKVILPINDLKDNEIFAPSYRDGEEVILVRFPYSGPFESPRLIVNNSNKEARSIIGLNSEDAVGINVNNAHKLSGADFDGDTVVVIPTNGLKLKAVNDKGYSEIAEKLADFEPQDAYPGYPGMKIISDTQKQMGVVSNLIMDMTLKGASADELARAVKHSMVIIDAEKHALNYKLSYKENGIEELKIKYQGKSTGGASTLLTKAKSDVRMNTRKEVYGPNVYKRDEKGNYVLDKDGNRISLLSDKEKEAWYKGEKVYISTNQQYKEFQYEMTTDKDGKKVPLRDADGKKVYKRDENGEKIYTLKYRNIKVPKMETVKDAYELSSGTPVESYYAEYANKLKELANQSRSVIRSTPTIQVNSSAKELYKNEVASLNSKVAIAKSNKPLERKAQAIASVYVESRKQDNPSMDSDELKKIKTQALAQARAVVGSDKVDTAVKITPSEWKAIQSGAISSNQLNEILNNTDLDVIRQYATPRAALELSKNQISRIENYAHQGLTNAEIADELGISTSTVSKYLNN